MINKDEIFELTQNGAQQLNDELQYNTIYELLKDATFTAKNYNFHRGDRYYE